MRLPLWWALGTFHATALVLVLVWFVYRGGGLGSLLSGLNTLTGFAIFAVLWVITLFTTRRALSDIDWLADDPAAMGQFFWRALRWGAVSGVSFLAVLIAGVLVATIASAASSGRFEATTALFVLLVYGSFGTLFAATIGAVIGVSLGALDIAALRIARALTSNTTEAPMRTASEGRFTPPERAP